MLFVFHEKLYVLNLFGILGYVFHKAIADVEKAIIDALDKQYADVLSPVKEHTAPKKFGLKYVQKLAKRSVCPYIVPDEVSYNLSTVEPSLIGNSFA